MRESKFNITSFNTLTNRQNEYKTQQTKININ